MLEDEQQNINHSETKKAWKLLGLAFIVLFIGSFIYSFLVLYSDDISHRKTKEQEKDSVVNNLGENYPKKNALPKVNQEKLEKEYKSKIEDIIASYQDIKLNSTKEKIDKFSYETLDKLFEMVVPAQYKDFHFSLVIALNRTNEEVASKDKIFNLEQSIEEIGMVVSKWDEI